MSPVNRVGKPPSFRTATAFYLAALALIGLFAIATNRIEDKVVAREANTARVINESGRQRMLSQRIAGLSLQLAVSAAGSDRAQTLSALEDSIGTMRASHHRLLALATDASGGAERRAAMQSLYFGEPHQINRQVETFLALADQIAAAPVGSLHPDDPRIEQIQQTAYAPLLNGLESVVSEEQHESERAISSLRHLLLTLLWGLLAILVAEALFLYRPLFRHLADVQHRLIEAMQTDPLTGCLNRRFLSDIAEREFDRCKRYEANLAVLVIDIDHFKSVNDTYGHAAGDQALIVLTQNIRTTVRSSDTLGRIGGEEFVLLLPGTTLDEANTVAERVRGDVAATKIHAGLNTFSITISIGLTMIDRMDSNFPDALARADRGMYSAKKSGKDRVVIDPPLSMSDQASLATKTARSGRDERRRPPLGV